MTFSGIDNITFKGKNPFPLQKINKTSALMTIPADKLKIEIPINIIIKRYVQQACISNLLVTVFAARHLDISLMTDNFKT